jgi:hypothetical protein
LSAIGVGSNDEDALPAVRGVDIGSAYARPLRVVPDFGQVAEYSSESEPEVPWDVLQDDEPRS